jgi:hypothetical protein
MSHQEHPEFVPPEPSTSKIWRYMDLAKLLAILNTRSLYFVRLDQLSEFDPFEGYYTNLNIAFDQLRFADMPDEWKESTGIKDEKTFSAIMGANKTIREMAKYHRTVTFVNSWHIKEHESAAMWKVYLSNNEGIAVQSTYEKLVASLDSYKDFNVHVGRIKYIDYQREVIPMGNGLSPFLYKRKSFEYEDELRALIWTPEHGKNDIIHPQNNKFRDVLGLNVAVDLDILVEKIFLSPNAPQWIGDIVRSVIKKYGLEKDVVQSDLASTPLY